MQQLGGRFTFDQKTIDEIRQLRMRDPETNTVKVLAERYNTTKGNISKICNRRTRKHRIDIYRDGVALRDETRI